MAGAARRIAVLLGLVGALALVGGSSLASTGTGTQNPLLTVSLALTNPGGGADGDPETVADGEVVTASASLTNNSAVAQTVLVRLSAQAPDGAAITIPSRISVGAGQTLSVARNLPVKGDFFQQGTYEATLSALPVGSDLDAAFPSVATATITLV